jgi:hypothetical protein
VHAISSGAGQGVRPCTGSARMGPDCSSEQSRSRAALGVVVVADAGSHAVTAV